VDTSLACMISCLFLCIKLIIKYSMKNARMFNCCAHPQSHNLIQELRQEFSDEEPVAQYTVFNTASNSYRLITAVHYDAQRCYIRAIWTHAQYSERYNKDKLSGGLL